MSDEETEKVNKEMERDPSNHASPLTAIQLYASKGNFLRAIDIGKLHFMPRDAERLLPLLYSLIFSQLCTRGQWVGRHLVVCNLVYGAFGGTTVDVSLNIVGKWPTSTLACASSRRFIFSSVWNRLRIWFGISSGPGALFGASRSTAHFNCSSVISSCIWYGCGYPKLRMSSVSAQGGGGKNVWLRRSLFCWFDVAWLLSVGTNVDVGCESRYFSFAILFSHQLHWQIFSMCLVLLYLFSFGTPWVFLSRVGYALPFCSFCFGFSVYLSPSSARYSTTFYWMVIVTFEGLFQLLLAG